MAVGMVIALAVALGIATVVALAVFLVLRLRAGEPMGLSFRTILVGYFHLMSIAAVLLLAVGLTTLLKAGLSQALGLEFSYYLPTREMVAVPAPIERSGESAAPTAEQQDEALRQERERVERQVRDDLLQGATLAVVGGILWPLHAFGRRRLTRTNSALETFFDRAHAVILLVIFSLVGIISLPVAVYELLRYLIFPPDQFGRPNPPGEAVATAIVFVPLWIYHLLASLREMRRETIAVES